jgi:hypothetical protein
VTTDKKTELVTKQQEKLLDAAVAIEDQGAVESGNLGFFARALTQCTLPHSKPANDAITYGKRNGKLSLTVQPGDYLDKSGKPISHGVPYGSIPRLLLCWISTEATRTKSRELVLGHSLSEFMAAIDLTPSWGRRGTAKSLTDQMERLFNCTIRLTYEDSEKRAVTRLDVTEDYCLFFHKHPDQGGLWQSTLTLTQKFYDEVTKHPVPLDLRALRALKKSPLAIDLYCWMTYRMSYLKGATPVTWAQLHGQFGADYARLRAFKGKFTVALQKVLAVYPDANFQITEDGLTLLPSKTHIPKKGKTGLIT